MTTEVLGRTALRRARPVNRTRERIFFGGMTLLMLTAVLLGFRMTYFPLGARPAALSSWVIQLHGTLIAWSYAARRRPDMHKRLALYATLSMMDAGIDRWPWAAWGVSESWSPWIYTVFLLLPVVYDLLSLGRVHRATMFAAPFAWTLHRLEIPLGHTQAWHVVANFMLSFPR